MAIGWKYIALVSICRASKIPFHYLSWNMIFSEVVFHFNYGLVFILYALDLSYTQRFENMDIQYLFWN